MTRGLAQRGLFSLRECASALAYRLHRPADRTAARAQLEEQLAGGHLLSIQVEGQKEGYYAPVAARSLLAELAADRVPQAWRPVESTTDEEATFLSPLDNLLDGTVKLSLWGGDSGPKVGNDRRIRDRIRPVPALATARTGPAWGGFVQ